MQVTAGSELLYARLEESAAGLKPGSTPKVACLRGAEAPHYPIAPIGSSTVAESALAHGIFQGQFELDLPVG